VDTSTDSYQDSSLELSHSRKRKRLNDDKENSEITKKIVKKRWTEKEIQSVGYYFSDYIENHILPSLPKIKEIQRDYNVLQTRTSAVVKTWLHNQIRNAKKQKNIPLPLKKVKTRKSPSKEYWTKQMTYIFASHLTKGHVPSIHECREVIKGNKIFAKISPKKMQNYVTKIIKKGTEKTK